MVIKNYTSYAVAGEGRKRRWDTGAALGAGASSRANGAWGSERRTVRRLVIGLAVLIVGWVALNFALEQAAVAVFSDRQNGAWAAITRLDKLISALILFLLAADAAKRRLRFVASGFLVLAFGQYALNYLRSSLGDAWTLNAQTYDNLILFTFAYALLVVGLVPDTPPRLSWRWGLAVFALFGALGASMVASTELLPQLVTVPAWQVANVVGYAPLPGLTGWYFALFTVPLGLAVAAAAGTVRQDDRGETVGGWITIAMVLLAGAQVHHLFWPLPHPAVMTSTRILFFAVSTVVVLGGILELRRIARERAALLAAEEERTRRLRELAALKADFTAMVAHELVSPVAAIQGYADMLSTGELAPDRQARILERVGAEADALNSLIADVKAAATVERDDFRVEPRPVSLESLLNAATAYARTLPGNHPFTARTGAYGVARRNECVLADPERIGQVLRNLLQNAAKYSPEGTPIELRVVPADDTGAADGGGGRVRIEVADSGWGLRPDELSRIFEKFGRGREMDKRVEGAGLGLYLSRRITRAHGSELTVRSTLGEGSVFVFDLEIVD